MIDLATETAVPLSLVPQRFPHLGRNFGEAGRKRLCFSTVWRWVNKGVLGPQGRRVKLEALKLGGQLVTTEQAIQRFAEALTPAPRIEGEPLVVASLAPGKRKAAERADAELMKRGI
jgi:hypothetical protein